MRRDYGQCVALSTLYVYIEAVLCPPCHLVRPPAVRGALSGGAAGGDAAEGGGVHEGGVGLCRGA